MLKVSNIKISVRDENQDSAIKNYLYKIFKYNIDNYIILKKSIDARYGSEKHFKGVYYIYEVALNINNEDKYLKDNNISKYKEEKYE